MKAILFVAAVFLSSAQCQRLTDYVRTSKGYIQGRSLETALRSYRYSSFMGVPYAKPPVDKRRFKAPEEPDPWNGVKRTITEGPPCATQLMYYPFGKEDCLYLNVYTPEMNFKNITELRPVMFWVFGGGYQAGSSDQFMYGPDLLVENNVVVVTINYRLAALGFLSLPGTDAPGNQGFKDMVMALEWVQTNIAYFGGDPNRVTLFGESAGAAAVGYLQCSPRSRDLFHQVIMQSATQLSPWGYMTPKQARDRAFDLGKRMEIYTTDKDELLHALREADVRRVIAASSTMLNVFLPFPIFMPFVGAIEEPPYYNNTFMTECPITTIQSGLCKRVPAILGYNKDETIIFSEAVSIGQQVVAKQVYRITTPLVRRIGNVVSDIVNPAVNSSMWEMIKKSSLHYFSGPIDIMQRHLTYFNGDKPVYYYHMSHDTEYNFHRIIDPNINGTSHGDDLSLIFHMCLKSPTDPDIPYNRFRYQVVGMWTNFAKYGDPTPDDSLIGTRWLPSGPEGSQLEIEFGKFYMRDRIIQGADAAKGRAYVEKLRNTEACRQIVDNPPQVYKPDSISSPGLLGSVLTPILSPIKPILDPIKPVLDPIKPILDPLNSIRK